MTAISFTDLRPWEGDQAQILLMKLADKRRTREGTALASAARTTQTTTADLTNHDCSHLLVWVNITVASGTGGIRPILRAKDPTSGESLWSNTAPTAKTAVALVGYLFGPSANVSLGLSTDVSQIAGIFIPRTFSIVMLVGDASSYTYSVGYCLIP